VGLGYERTETVENGIEKTKCMKSLNLTCAMW